MGAYKFLGVVTGILMASAIVFAGDSNCPDRCDGTALVTYRVQGGGNCHLPGFEDGCQARTCVQVDTVKNSLKCIQLAKQKVQSLTEKIDQSESELFSGNANNDESAWCRYHPDRCGG